MTRIAIQVVPDAEPNADGYWMEENAEVWGGGFQEVELALKPFIPPGHHMVAYEFPEHVGTYRDVRAMKQLLPIGAVTGRSSSNKTAWWNSYTVTARSLTGGEGVALQNIVHPRGTPLRELLGDFGPAPDPAFPYDHLPPGPDEATNDDEGWL